MTRVTKNVKIWTSSLQMPLPVSKSPGFIKQNRTGQLVYTFCKLFLSIDGSSVSVISKVCFCTDLLWEEQVCLISLGTMGYCRERPSCVCVCETHALLSSSRASPLIRAVNVQQNWLILSPLLQPTHWGRWEPALKWLQGQPQGAWKDRWRTWNTHSLIVS